MNARLEALAEAGVSIWLDDLSRERIESGSLASLIQDSSVVGVTTNPTIFAGALADGALYQSQIRELKSAGADVAEAVTALTTTDVAKACDLFARTFATTGGVDGRVSIEVDPGLARDTDGTVEMAQRLWSEVDRPNLLIKIPATHEGLPAIAATIAEGISVNVTLIFSLDRYREVMDAYLYGLEQAAAEGRDLSQIHSVASFFISRVDSEIDGRLTDGHWLRGQAGVANARLAYAAYLEVFGSERFANLRELGANVQRPLWASTGVKDPAYRDTMYVEELIVAGTVNTMPEKTMAAFADHGDVAGDAVTANFGAAREVLAELAKAGIDYQEVVEKLETEGLEKFDQSWAELLETVQHELDKA